MMTCDLSDNTQNNQQENASFLALPVVNLYLYSAIKYFTDFLTRRKRGFLILPIVLCTSHTKNSLIELRTSVSDVTVFAHSFYLFSAEEYSDLTKLTSVTVQRSNNHIP